MRSLGSNECDVSGECQPMAVGFKVFVGFKRDGSLDDELHTASNDCGLIRDRDSDGAFAGHTVWAMERHELLRATQANPTWANST